MSRDWNFARFLDRVAAGGDAPALIAVRAGALETLSCEALASRVRALASGLLQAGLPPGEAVGLIGPNGFDWVVARLALGVTGAVAVAIDDLATDAEILAILEQCKATRIICHASRAPALCQAKPDLNLIVFGDGPVPDGAQRLDSLETSSAQPIPALGADATAMLAYTSGTTGAPKAIVLSLANIATNVDTLVESRLVARGDRVLLPLPLHHVYPFVVGLLASLGSGATVVFPESTTGPHILEANRLAGVTAIVGVPRLYSAICDGLTARIATAGLLRRALFRKLLSTSVWLRKNLSLNPGPFFVASLRARFGSRLRLLVSGGAKLEPSALHMLLGLGFDIRSGYGLAETASSFTGNLPGNERWGSEGKAFAGSVRIANPDSNGIGEIELKGPQVFSRYLDNPEATHAAFTPDGWFRTGDVGLLDKDGFLFVTGRAKDILVLGGGKKIDPEGLEKIYGASRYIREIAIFEHHGTLAALVVPSLEAIKAGGAIHIDTAIRVDLASKAHTLPSYQRLAGFAITREPLPRTRLGKFRRFLLPQIYDRAQQPRSGERKGALSEEDKRLLENPVARQVYEMLVKRYPHAELALDASPLLDLGIDSLEWISFGLELEDRLDLRLSEADIGGVATVRDLLTIAVEASSRPSVEKADTLEWTRPAGAITRALGPVISAANWLLMRGIFRLEVQGADQLPREGNFVLIANHVSYLDPPSLAAAMGYARLRRCYWAGDPALLFVKAWQRAFMRVMQVYPLNERTPAQSLAASEAILERGDSIVWFPEGWRSPDGTLQQFLPGIGHLLTRNPVPVIPAFIEGSFEAWPRDRSWPRPGKIRVRIGAPIPPSEWSGGTECGKDKATTIAGLLHDKIAELGKQANPAR